MAMGTLERRQLDSQQLEDLQAFLKDWLRHTGRTQADLRRALHASSIRMPVLLGALQDTYSRDGLSGLAARLCGIEALWRDEDGWQEPVGGGRAGEGLGGGLEDSLGDLDLLLQEIRQDRQA